MISKYRADIDGLRAIAVLSVVLFHLHVAGLTGGYVGVDIFFVISGYLITGLIYEEIAARTFSLKTFYLRRIRRIAPALVVTLVATSAVSFLVLKPEEMRSFATSLALQAFSAQNFFFLSEGEYFVGADLKPLLHTWSLAVEEQFYLFWPLVLLVLVRRAFKVQLLVLVAILLASFAANMILMGISPKASFFMLPTRAWELGAGGLVAILERKAAFRAALTPGRRSILGVVGLAFMAYGFVAFTAKTPFPGTAAILPVAAALCVLLSGIGAPTFVGRALSIKPIVAIGLISYPMYLWHWPIISLSHQFDIDLGQPSNAAAIIVATVVLAALTYRYVEQPIRFKRWLPQPSKLVWSAAASFGILFALGIHLWISNGAAYRYGPVARNLLTAPLDARKDRCGILFKALHPRDAACTMASSEGSSDAKDTRRVLLWGNSHADQWSSLFEHLAAEHRAEFHLTARNCRPTLDSDFCGKRVQDSVIDYIAAKRITDVVLASTGYGSYDVPDDLYEKELRAVAARLAASGVRIWLVIDNPAGANLNPVAAYEAEPSNPKIGALPAADHLRVKTREATLFAEIAKRWPVVRTIDPSIDLCQASTCPGGKGEVIWYRDSNHVSNSGAMVAKEQFRPIFDGSVSSASGN